MQKDFMRSDYGQRIIQLSFLFMIVYSVILTLSPTVRARSWDAELRWEHWIGTAVWAIVFVYLIRNQKILYPNANQLILPTIGLLTGWGQLTIWRLIPDLGLKQTVWIIISGGVFYLGMRYLKNLRILREYKYLLLVSGLIITSLTFILGTNPLGYGPRLWLGCCGLFLQPSEPLKLLLIIFLAGYFSDRQPILHNLKALLVPALIMTGITLFILGAQRDLGTGLIFVFIFTGIIYVATEDKHVLVFSLIGILTTGSIGYLLFDIVQIRVDAWVNPWIDPSGNSYQIVQSLIATASGGVIGQGPGIGNPGLVPIAHSDFIFSTIIEETGLLGGSVIMVIFAFITLQGFNIASNADNRFDRYLAVGISTYLASQSLFIIGGTIRGLPLTGITLPFVSYGGSSLLTSFMGILILLHISQNQAGTNNKPSHHPPLFFLTKIFIYGYLLMLLILGWWTVAQREALIQRSDNARRYISDSYVARGSIFDRNNNLLSSTTGELGNYQRIYHFPVNSPLLGYISPFYGQAGAEVSLDPILRGLENQHPLIGWSNNLLYGQFPPGFDAKITLDQELQSYTSTLMGDTNGAVVLMNANNGQILVMYSYPFYDPNTLEEDWTMLINNPNSPLINRAAQGKYQPGGILGAFYLAYSDIDPNDEIPSNLRLEISPTDLQLNFDINEDILRCSKNTVDILTWAEGIVFGCPGVILSKELNVISTFSQLINDLNFLSTPEIKLPVGLTSSWQLQDTFVTEEILGQGLLQISPLQLALAASALTNHGIIPAPQFLLAAKNPEGEWIQYDLIGNSNKLLSPTKLDNTAFGLNTSEKQVWGTTALAYDGEERILTWHMGGTLPTASTDGYVVVILLEEENPELAILIGESLLQQIQQNQD